MNKKELEKECELVTAETKKLINKLDKIKEELDKLGNKFEVGKWYKDEHYKDLIFITELRGEQIDAYGFDTDGSWFNEDVHYSTTRFKYRPATPQEVEPALIAEANKRGYKKDVFVNSMESSQTCKHINARIDGYDFANAWYESEINSFGLGNKCIFKNGQWAEIIECNEVAKDKVVINDYDMVMVNDYIEFGCARFHVNRIKELNEVVDNWFALKDEGRNNRYIKSITLDSGVEITIDQLKQIVDHIE